ncbi:TPA: hypothetical protein ACPKAL_000983 [Vibrio alginolyticus]|uniref:hypothetical protein n=1 Tax=Vibrio alginolyticus TaxID=663 RepID=UPI001F2084D7|nr:hypothetical protein [Vibrio alginolyticus]MDM4737527.1 hypothetical protein [Vibrio alginolyticus]MDM4757873.1 hypothetical protein [Vibrio alginolyticus]
MGAKALLLFNPVFEANPLLLAVGDEIIVAEKQQQAPDKKNTFPPLCLKTYNNIRQSHYQHSGPLLVFAKSCTRPEGCIEIGDQQKSISNFGPWSFFFAQANVNPAAVIPAIQATQAQMAMGSLAAVAGSPEQTQQSLFGDNTQYTDQDLR